MMPYEASDGASVFQIDDDEDDDLADPTSHPIRVKPPLLCGEGQQENQKLLRGGGNTAADPPPSFWDTVDRMAGTAGCCGAVCMLFGCLSCGLCWREMRETYAHHTLCGRWCPV